ncbi:hypothetical protein Hdeb2414_s0001g00011811 [Helianthus debilis subsp. tardiflorus]
MYRVMEVQASIKEEFLQVFQPMMNSKPTTTTGLLTSSKVACPDSIHVDGCVVKKSHVQIGLRM